MYSILCNGFQSRFWEHALGKHSMELRKKTCSIMATAASILYAVSIFIPWMLGVQMIGLLWSPPLVVIWEFYSFKVEADRFSLSQGFHSEGFLSYWFGSNVSGGPHTLWLGIFIVQVTTGILGFIGAMKQTGISKTLSLAAATTVSWIGPILAYFQSLRYLNSGSFGVVNFSTGFWTACLSALLFTLSLSLTKLKS